MGRRLSIGLDAACIAVWMGRMFEVSSVGRLGIGLDAACIAEGFGVVDGCFGIRGRALRR